MEGDLIIVRWYDTTVADVVRVQTCGDGDDPLLSFILWDDWRTPAPIRMKPLSDVQVVYAQSMRIEE